MDQMMVNIGDGEAYNGDEVVLIGAQGNERVTVEELAAAMDITPHVVVVSLTERIPRRYVP
jgi:alanine racemase